MLSAYFARGASLFVCQLWLVEVRRLVLTNHGVVRTQKTEYGSDDDCSYEGDDQGGKNGTTVDLERVKMRQKAGRGRRTLLAKGLAMSLRKVSA